ncbi:ABC transporter substrate-binding protein [Sutcliffiella halmapala]|uniref:ABC transporter substrate-binding protein n=1 Tax=Sutcliffiella halmapala TaxID=79882 RepID=UPI000994B994|nr:extracellular solute-binding protein [Sutcliffiella halmapala]
MKMLKPWLAILTIIVFLIGCSKDTATNTSKDEVKEEGNKDAVTITFASWALGTEEERNLERIMIEEFQAQYPHITVEIDESISGDWNDALSAAASANAMPDVFMLAQIPTGLANDWLLDLNELTENDEDFAQIPEVVRDSATFEDTVVALPKGQNFLGYFVNKDLYNQANLNVPEHGFAIEEFVNSVRQITNLNNGVVGISNPHSIPDWYPAAANENIGWFTFSDEEYHLDSNEFINGINLANNIVSNNYSFDSLTDDQQASFNGENDGEVWAAGGTGLRWDGTWAIPNYTENLEFDWDFIGIPGGRTVIVNDYMGISKSTKHAEEAYLFAKYMSFGKEGYMRRLEVAVEEDKVVNGLPASADPEVLDAYFEIQDLPGLRIAYENLENGIIEPVKTVPGYVQSRWEAPTGVAVGESPNANISELLGASIRGEIKIEDYISQINELANQKYQEGKEAIGQ